MSAEQLALFHRTLSELCRSNLPLPRALRALAGDLDRGPLRLALDDMAAEVEAGVGVAEAYGRRRDLFPPSYRALVEAGMAGGDLAGVLEAIAGHAERRAAATRAICEALAWPFASALLILLVGGLALGLALPRLWGFSETLSGASPLPYAAAALGALALLMLAGTVVTRRRGAWQGTFALSLPVLGPIRLDEARATVASTLALLLHRRLPLADALELAGRTAAARPIEARLLAAAARAADGASLADALRSAELLDESSLWLIASAEAHGAAAEALEDVAGLHRRRLDRRLARFTLFVRPTAELVLGAVVFAFAFSYLVPLFRYTSEILGGA